MAFILLRTCWDRTWAAKTRSDLSGDTTSWALVSSSPINRLISSEHVLVLVLGGDGGVLCCALPTDALIFVVDSSDVGRMEDAKNEFLRIVDDAEIKDASVLVFANKCDLPKAASAAEVAELLDLGRLAQEGRAVHVQSACARSGEGLTQGIDWLTEQLLARSKKTKKK